MLRTGPNPLLNGKRESAVIPTYFPRPVGVRESDVIPTYFPRLVGERESAVILAYFPRPVGERESAVILTYPSPRRGEGWGPSGVAQRRRMGG